MGSPNFSKCDFVTLGMTAKADISDEAIAQYRLDCLDDSENDSESPCFVKGSEIRERIQGDESELIFGYYQLTEDLTDALNRFIGYNYGGVNPLADFGNQLITFELEQGYHDGFRIVINTECPELKDLKCWYAYCQPSVGGYRYGSELPAGMSFEQFKNCYYKVLDFCQYALVELSKLTPLCGVGGGWTGGEYTHEPNTEDAHKRFKPAFDMLMGDIKDAGLTYISTFEEV